MTDDPFPAARARVERLQAALQARLVETHISWVLLTEAHAIKLKKPVRLPFLDFTSLATRRRCCEEEVRLNRRLAPSLYLGVVDVHDGPAGPALEGAGPVVDVAVRMRRFPDDALWSDRVAAGTLAPRDVDTMARRLAGFHRDAAVAPPASRFGSPAVHARVTGNLLAEIDTWAATGAPDTDWPVLRAWLQAQLRELAPLWEARRQAGRVRECHGDLHLANVVQLGDGPTAFDGIEFDDDLRWIDVLDDAAFLAMDLLAHDRQGLAFRFLNGWLDESGEHDGVPALRFCMVRRAAVRAHVAALAGAGPRAACYLAVAQTLSRGADPRLVITHGLPGSGKTFASQGLLEATGAIRLRSDVERKRLFGLAPLASSRDHVPGGIYDAASTARTYARLHDLADVALQAGWPVIVDAAFLRRAERGAFAGLAARRQAPFSILECQAPFEVLRRRIEQRQAQSADASEADVAVLERLAGADEPLDEGERRVAIEAA